MNNQILTPENKKIILNTGSYNTSQRYEQIPTNDVIKELEKYNEMKVVNFGASKVRKEEKQNKQKHFIIMEGDNAKLVDGTNIQFGIFNSSDRSSALKIYISLFKFVCSNGLVVSEDLIEPLSIRHTKKTHEDEDWRHSVASLMSEYENMKKTLTESIIAMQNRYMSYGDTMRLAERVTEDIVNPNIKGELISPISLTVPKRKEDTNKDLYSVYNIIQEHMLAGELPRIIKKEVEDENGQTKLMDLTSNTHVVTDISKRIKMNQQLHSKVLELL